MTLLQRRTKKQRPCCQLGQERFRLGMQPFTLLVMQLLLLRVSV